MRFDLTTDESLEKLKRYDPHFYEHYLNNIYYIGNSMKNYAVYLQEQHNPDNYDRDE